MAWQALTATSQIGSSASMAAGSSLNRAWAAIPATSVLTAWKADWHIAAGALGTTYTAFAAGQFARYPTWLIGISYVPTGSTPPVLDTAADSALFLWVDEFSPYMDRNTINQANAPAYADEFIYGGKCQGRTQLGTGVGGSIFFHLANTGSGTVSTAWQAFIRASYAANL